MTLPAMVPFGVLEADSLDDVAGGKPGVTKGGGCAVEERIGVVQADGLTGIGFDCGDC